MPYVAQTIQSNLSIWQVFKTVFKIDNMVFPLTIRHIEFGHAHRHKPESDEEKMNELKRNEEREINI